jgi:hypothetical protein
MRVSSFVGALVLVSIAIPALAASPMPEVGSAAPPLALPSADGGRRSLADVGGPVVLIFYRGLW